MFKIEKNIPLPPRGAYLSKDEYPFEKLLPGDSFAIPYSRPTSRIGGAIVNASNRLHIKLSWRVVIECGEKVIRVWRMDGLDKPVKPELKEPTIFPVPMTAKEKMKTIVGQRSDHIKTEPRKAERPKTGPVYPFRTMKVGDSFTVPHEKRGSIAGQASLFGKRHHVKFSTSVIFEGGKLVCRVWRVA